MTTFNVTNDTDFDAALLLANDGDTIKLAAGNYIAEHTIDAGITVQGAKGSLSVLSGGLEIAHSGVTIDRVTVTGGSDFSAGFSFPLTGIYIPTGAAGAKITNTVFDVAAGNFGLVSNAVGVAIANNTFSGVGNGVYLVASATGGIQGNQFNELDGSIGIQTESTGVKIQKNTFTDLGDGGAAIFVTTAGSTDASAFILANKIGSILPSHSVNIEVSEPGALTIIGTAYDDAIYTSDYPDHVAALTMAGLAGDDEMWGGIGADTFIGGVGIDIMHGLAGADTFVVSGKNDTFDTFDGGADIDTLQVIGKSDVTLNGFDATADSIEVWAGNNRGMIGTSAAETFDVSGLTAITALKFIDGGGGIDLLIGSEFADTLRGGKGNFADILDGNAGNDFLAGGGGSDSFVYKTGYATDTVTDYKRGEDQFDITYAGFTDFGDLVMTQVGKDVMLSFASGDELIIGHTTIAVLTANQSDFIFN